jgi:hypothetical protein
VADDACPSCGSTSRGAFVEYGSYFMRCLNCGDDGPATSWLAIASRLRGPISAFLAEPWPDGILFAEGESSVIAETVARAASTGKLVRIVMKCADA